MCDYSLCGLPTRLAVEGEELVVYKFQSGSMGLASPEELTSAHKPLPRARKSFWEHVKSIFKDPPRATSATAVCVPPGAQLILRNVPEDLQHRWNIREEEGVFFVQTSADENQYRDAVRFRNGLSVLLQSLREGIRVQVLFLGDAAADGENVLAMPVITGREIL